MLTEDASDCLGVLQGHTSLVGQLQMRGDTLVTGSSDGSVWVWSLHDMAPLYQLAAHTHGVVSLQFDDIRVVSGGGDGLVKVWDLKTGQLVRELGKPADIISKVAFEDEKAVVIASRNGQTVMEVRLCSGSGLLMLQSSNPKSNADGLHQVRSFSPPLDDVSHQVARSETPASVRDSTSTNDDDGNSDMKKTAAPERAPA